MPCGRNVALRRWDKGKEWCFCRCFEQYKKTPSILYLRGRPTAALRRRAPEENSAFERIAFEWAAAALSPLLGQKRKTLLQNRAAVFDLM